MAQPKDPTLCQGHQIPGGPAPNHEDTPAQIIDGRTTFGGWAYLCPACHAKYGVGLGMGKGTKFDQTPYGLRRSKP